jgi:hypothetical protein
MTAVVAFRRDGTSLLGWLRLIGWQVEITRSGRGWSGTASRVTPEGDELRVGHKGTAYRDVVSELYRGALVAPSIS